MSTLPPAISNDVRLSKFIKKNGLGENLTDERWRRPAHPFHALIRSIIHQQVSGKAAQSILSKFKDIYGGRFPKPEELLKTPDQKLRKAGLSGQKAAYVKDLAKHFESGAIKHRDLKKWTIEEIVEHLTQVKGIGVWTAHMFLLFTLKRPDVLPTLDLAIRKGFQVVYGLKKEPSHNQMEKLAKGWRQNASLVSLYLWKAADAQKITKAKK